MAADGVATGESGICAGEFGEESPKMPRKPSFVLAGEECAQAEITSLPRGIIPGTMQILRECVERGWYTAFIDAGAVVSTPTCGPCLGGYMGILAEGEKCVATTNRNFVGRMGHVKSEVYLASPHTAAASALTGYITEYKEV